MRCQKQSRNLASIEFLRQQDEGAGWITPGALRAGSAYHMALSMAASPINIGCVSFERK